MCGRFVSSSTLDDVSYFFGATPMDLDLDERYNVAPTSPIYAVVPDDDQRVVNVMRWGFLPHWAKSQTGKPMINARAETIAENRGFARSFRQRRCLIPADGFYEWTTNRDGSKQPHYITHRDGDLFAFAGIWRTWTDPVAETELTTCAIITCVPNDVMVEIHDRMPAILAPNVWDQWLHDGSANRGLLTPAPNELFRTYKVTTDVNSARNDRPDLITPVA